MLDNWWPTCNNIATYQLKFDFKGQPSFTRYHKTRTDGLPLPVLLSRSDKLVMMFEMKDSCLISFWPEYNGQSKRDMGKAQTVCAKKGSVWISLLRLKQERAHVNAKHIQSNVKLHVLRKQGGPNVDKSKGGPNVDTLAACLFLRKESAKWLHLQASRGIAT